MSDMSSIQGCSGVSKAWEPKHRDGETHRATVRRAASAMGDQSLRGIIGTSGPTFHPGHSGKKIGRAGALPEILSYRTDRL
jgi:hypothetical protein